MSANNSSYSCLLSVLFFHSDLLSQIGIPEILGVYFVECSEISDICKEAGGLYNLVVCGSGSQIAWILTGISASFTVFQSFSLRS